MSLPGKIFVKLLANCLKGICNGTIFYGRLQTAAGAFHEISIHDLQSVTAGPLIDLWGIHNGEGHYPSPEELAQVLPLIGDEDLLVEPGRAYLARPGMIANLGAIAKGYIADQVKALLVEQGVEHGVLD